MTDDLQPWAGALALIGMLAVLALGLVGLSGAVWLMIWPVERRARVTQAAFRFRLIDLGCLLVYWQVILAAGAALATDAVGPALGLLIFLGALATFFSLLVWIAAVSVLSRAGIESSLRRAAFLLLQVPLSVLAPLAAGGSLVATIGSVVAAFNDRPTGAPLLLGPGLLLLAVTTILVLRRCALWIAADATSPMNATGGAGASSSSPPPRARLASLPGEFPGAARAPPDRPV